MARGQTGLHTEATCGSVALGADAARMYGMICTAVRATGPPPHRWVAGLMLASIAAVTRLPLSTTNPADYQGLDDLLTIVAIPRPGPTSP